MNPSFADDGASPRTGGGGGGGGSGLAAATSVTTIPIGPAVDCRRQRLSASKYCAHRKEIVKL